MSIVILLTLAAGILVGIFLPQDFGGVIENLSSIMLLLLIFSVGIDIGLNREVLRRIKRLGVRILLIPLGIIAGSLLGGALAAVVLRSDLRESLAITSGLGWYSLSGILLTEAGNPVAGSISFLSNVIREMITFVAVPFLASHMNAY